MVTSRSVAIVRGVAVVSLLLTLAAVWSQPVRDRILDDVSITPTDGHYAIKVSFTTPVRYETHFPAHTGDDLRIQLQPVGVPFSELDAVIKRESVRPPDSGAIGLMEVIYEGDIEGGPFLTLHFDHAVTFEVIQEPDFRSLTVLVNRDP